MVRGWTAAICIFSASTATAVEAASSIDIGAAAKSWAPQFVLTGTKTEPTYIEHIRLERDGARFVLQGGAPAGMPSSREVVLIDADGSLRHIECPAAMRCDNSEPPSGFLASAAIVAAIGRGRLSGFFSSLSVRIIPSRLRLRREVGCARSDTRSVRRNPERRRDGVAPPDVRAIRGPKPRSMVDQHIDSKVCCCILR